MPSNRTVIQMNPANLTNHVSNEAVPPMPAEAYAALLASMRANGQTTPITITGDGRVVDGWHRVRAARELGRAVECVVVEMTDAEALTASLVANVSRRHLTTSQRALAAAKLVGTVQGRHAAGAMTQQQAADAFTVSIRYVREAQRLLATNDADAINAVWTGARTLHAALPARPTTTRRAVRQEANAEAEAQVVAIPATGSPADAMLAALGFVMSGSLEGAAFAQSLVDRGMSPADRNRVLLALDEFARTAYDAAAEQGIAFAA